MRTPDIAEMFSVSIKPLAADLLIEQIGVDADGNVHLVQRNEDGETVSSRSWGASSGTAATVHDIIEWLARGASGSFADHII